jgi:hypothetical protein
MARRLRLSVFIAQPGLPRSVCLSAHIRLLAFEAELRPGALLPALRRDLRQRCQLLAMLAI